MRKNLGLRTIIALGLIFAFLVNTFGPCPVYAQEGFFLPAPGQMVALSPAFSPAVLKGIKLDPQNPFRFHFFVDRGDSSLSQEELKSESAKLIKYFLASLTIPEKDLWVNLSPYEKDRIVPQEFGQTEMGRDLLAEDYLLKQITASLIYPESQLGKEFWQKVYAKAQAKYGTTNIPINTFNKVWIVPEKAVVYENGGVAFVLENHLKVMLEQDYLSLAKHEGIQSVLARTQDANQLGSQIVREIVIPALTKEVNEGKNFSQLRQVFYSLILATWYKKKIKDSILNKVYSNRNKIGGVNVSAGDKDRIYQEYLKAFKKGVYNYIKEEPDPLNGQTIPRKYFSGGFTALTISAIETSVGRRNVSHAKLAVLIRRRMDLNDVFGDCAMINKNSVLSVEGGNDGAMHASVINIVKKILGKIPGLRKDKPDNESAIQKEPYINILKRNNPKSGFTDTSNFTTSLGHVRMYKYLMDFVHKQKREFPNVPLRVLVLGPGSEKVISYQAIELAAILRASTENFVEMTFVDGSEEVIKAVSNPTRYKIVYRKSPSGLDDEQVTDALAPLLRDEHNQQFVTGKSIRNLRADSYFKVDLERLYERIQIDAFPGELQKIDYGSYPEVQMDIVMGTMSLVYAFTKLHSLNERLNLFYKIINVTKRNGQGIFLMTFHDFNEIFYNLPEENLDNAGKIDVVQNALAAKGLDIGINETRQGFLSITNNTETTDAAMKAAQWEELRKHVEKVIGKGDIFQKRMAEVIIMEAKKYQTLSLITVNDHMETFNNVRNMRIAIAGLQIKKADELEIQGYLKDPSRLEGRKSTAWTDTGEYTDLYEKIMARISSKMVNGRFEKEYQFNGKDGKLKTYPQVVIFDPQLKSGFRVYHALGIEVPDIMANLGRLWEKIHDKSIAFKQRKKALAEYEWWFFQCNPMKRAGASMGDAMSFIAQIALGIKLRDTYVHQDYDALSLTLGDYVTLRTKEFKANESASADDAMSARNASDKTPGYLEHVLRVKEDFFRNQEKSENDQRLLVNVARKKILPPSNIPRSHAIDTRGEEGDSVDLGMNSQLHSTLVKTPADGAMTTPYEEFSPSTEFSVIKREVYQYYSRIRNRINRVQRVKSVLSVASGVALNDVLAVTGAENFYMLDAKIGNKDLIKAKSLWIKMFNGQNIDPIMKLHIDMYAKVKRDKGFSPSYTSQMDLSAYGIIAELLSLGLSYQDVNFDKENGIPFLEFNKEIDGIKKMRRFYFINGNILNLSKISSGIDVYFQNAGELLPPLFKIIIPKVAKAIKRYFIVDPYTPNDEQYSLSPVLRELGIKYVRINIRTTRPFTYGLFKEVDEVMDNAQMTSKQSPVDRAMFSLEELKAGFNGKRILLVDDEPSFRSIPRQILQKLGAEVIEVDDGDEALRLIQEAEKEGRQFDGMITDYKMTRMSGVELIFEIKKLNLHVPVTIRTRGLSEDDQGKMKELDVPVVIKNDKYINLLSILLEQMQKEKGSSAESDAAMTARLTDYLKTYQGNALTIDDFLKDFQGNARKKYKQEEILKILAAEDLRKHIEEFTPNAIRLIVRLQASGYLGSFEARRHSTLENPRIGDLFFTDEFNFDGAFEKIYHPPTYEDRVLKLVPNSNKTDKNACFQVWAEFETGYILLGYTKGAFGTDQLKVVGDIPEDVQRLFRFIQKNVPDSEVKFGRETRSWPGSEEHILHFKGLNGLEEIKISDRNLLPKTNVEMGKEKMQVDWGLVKMDHKIGSVVQLKLAPLGHEFLWRNHWKDAVAYKGELGKIYEMLQREGLVGNKILELGDGGDPLSAQMFPDKKIVALALRPPQPLMAEGNKLTIQASIEHVDDISFATRKAIDGFLGIPIKDTKFPHLYFQFDTLVLSNVLNYVDAPKVIGEVLRYMRPQATVIIQNSVRLAITPASRHARGVKINEDLLRIFDKRPVDVQIFGFPLMENPFIPGQLMKIGGLEYLTRDDAEDFDGVLYLVVRRKSVNPIVLRLQPGKASAAGLVGVDGAMNSIPFEKFQLKTSSEKWELIDPDGIRAKGARSENRVFIFKEGKWRGWVFRIVRKGMYPEIDEQEKGFRLGNNYGITPPFVRGKIQEYDVLAVAYIEPVDQTDSLEDLVDKWRVDSRYEEAVRHLFTVLIQNNLFFDAAPSNIVIGYLDGKLQAWVVDAEGLQMDAFQSREELIKAYIEDIDGTETSWPKGSITSSVLALLKDSAQITAPQNELAPGDPGGIDLNPAQMSMQVKKEGQDFKFNFNGTEIDAAQVTGATFTIRTMTPVTNLPQLLGLNVEPADKSKQAVLLARA